MGNKYMVLLLYEVNGEKINRVDLTKYCFLVGEQMSIHICSLFVHAQLSSVHQGTSVLCQCPPEYKNE